MNRIEIITQVHDSIYFITKLKISQYDTTTVDTILIH